MPNEEKLTIKLNDLKFDEQNPRLPMRLQGIMDEKKSHRLYGKIWKCY